MAMNAEISNGLEAWRGLVKREEPTEGSTQFAVLMTIMRAQFSGGMQGLTEELEKLMGQVQRYEAQLDGPIADTIVQANIKSNCPDELKSQVTMVTYTSARELRDMPAGYAATRAAEFPGCWRDRQQGQGQEGRRQERRRNTARRRARRKERRMQEAKAARQTAAVGSSRATATTAAAGGHKKADCWKKPSVSAVEAATAAAAVAAAKGGEAPPGLAGSMAMIEVVGEEAGGEPAAEDWIF